MNLEANVIESSICYVTFEDTKIKMDKGTNNDIENHRKLIRIVLIYLLYLTPRSAIFQLYHIS